MKPLRIVIIVYETENYEYHLGKCVLFFEKAYYELAASMGVVCVSDNLVKIRTFVPSIKAS